MTINRFSARESPDSLEADQTISSRRGAAPMAGDAQKKCVHPEAGRK